MEVLHLQLNVSFYLTTPSITTTQQPNNAKQTPDINCSKNNRWVIRIGYYKHLLSSEIAHKREGGSGWGLFKALAWHTPREKAWKIRMKYRREQKRQKWGREAGRLREPERQECSDSHDESGGFSYHWIIRAQSAHCSIRSWSSLSSLRELSDGCGIWQASVRQFMTDGFCC